jgi:hypothetical protein
LQVRKLPAAFPEPVDGPDEDFVTIFSRFRRLKGSATMRTAPFVALTALVTACAHAPPATAPPPAAANTQAAAAVAPAAANVKVASINAPAVPALSGNDGVDQSLLKQGYHLGKHNGQVVYCKREAITGTRFESNVCQTADEIKEKERRAREELQGVHQGACLGPECGG